VDTQTIPIKMHIQSYGEFPITIHGKPFTDKEGIVKGDVKFGRVCHQKGS